MIHLACFHEPHLPAPLRQQCDALIAAAWPGQEMHLMPYWRLAAMDGEQVVGQQSVFDLRQRRRKRRPFRICGLGDLVVDPAWRGQGIARALITESVVACGTAWPVLTSTHAPEVEAVITSLGFAPVPEGRVSWGKRQHTHDHFWLRDGEQPCLPLRLKEGRF